MELIYSVNGQYFKQFGVNVEKSSGFGGLKRKAPQDFSFPDQNGASLDLSNPYFEAREIKLDCWIKGTDWQNMYNNFLLFMAEFKKPETQRLLIEYPPAKERIYQVYYEDDVELKSRIKKGVIFANFQLKLIEPNPIKKVLVSYGNSTENLKYTSPEETEIFLPNGIKMIANSNVDVDLDLNAENLVSNYQYQGRNLLRNSNFYKNINYWNPNGSGEIYNWSAESGGSLFLNNGGVQGAVYQNGLILENGFYAVSFDVKPSFQSGVAPYIVRIFLGGTYVSVPIHSLPQWKRYEIYINTIANDGNFIIQPFGSDQKLFFDNIKLEKGKVCTDWTPAPEDVKHIVIAGTISKVTNVIFNGDTLWKEL